MRKWMMSQCKKYWLGSFGYKQKFRKYLRETKLETSILGRMKPGSLNSMRKFGSLRINYPMIITVCGLVDRFMRGY